MEKESVKKLWKLIKKSRKILLINHTRMDMDALGSLMCMYDILTQNGKDVKAINDETPLERFDFIGYNRVIETNLNIKEYNPDLIISLDASSTQQLGKYYSDNMELFNKNNFVVIDHHITNAGFGYINIVDAKYSSTCELVYDIIKELKLKKFITPKIATTLLAGIYTDTNIFYNTNITKNTYNVVGELIELGADYRKPYYEFYKKKDFYQTKLWGEILANNMKEQIDGKLVYALVSKNVFKKTNTNDTQLTGLISEFFANIEGVKICFIAYEMEDNKVKVSFRSSIDYDVSSIAVSFGGGGHKQAAGFITEKSLKEIEKEIIEKIKEVLV